MRRFHCNLVFRKILSYQTVVRLTLEVPAPKRASQGRAQVEKPAETADSSVAGFPVRAPGPLPSKELNASAIPAHRYPLGDDYPGWFVHVDLFARSPTTAAPVDDWMELHRGPFPGRP